MDIEAAIRRQGVLESERSNFDSHWQEVQDYCLPQTLGFTSMQTPGTKKMEKVFDSTPITANEYFAAAMQSMLAPATEQWHRLVPIDADLAENYAVNAWCDEATETMFRARYAPRTGFATMLGEAFLSYGAFGNGVAFIDEKMGEHLVYRACHPSEHYFVENQWGAIDRMHRRFKLSAENCVDKFGRDKCPPKILDDAEKRPDTMHEILHVVCPATSLEYTERKVSPLHRFVSCYIAIAEKRELRSSGYRSFPYAVARYQTTPGETYGRGPGMTALPDIKTLNEMMKTILRAGQKAVDPPVLLHDDGALASFQMRPGALNRGAISADGKILAAPFISGARLDLSFEMIQDVRRRIESVFKVDLFRILVDKPQQITATEALIRAQEKGSLLAPPSQRAQGEFLGAIIARELDILIEAGQFPAMPDELAATGGVRVEYQAPVNQAQKAQKGISINTFLANVGAYAATDPSVLDAIDGDEIVRELRDVSGAPQKIIRPPEEIAARRQQKAEQAQTADALAGAEQSGKAAKDWAQAQATAASAPRQVIPLVQ